MLATTAGNESIKEQVQRRCTFAIISHPDAGKTTLTEKLLLYGGAIELAGSVRAKRNHRAATSDWMALEQQRGISITSTVLQFPYAGQQINLLDTPGHQDFSEDTYRTLTAADNAVMLIDAAKGIEPQTRKLFEVCRRRGIPIFTFINKLDRPGREPLQLLDELEKILGIGVFPINWPIGMGPTFRGVYDRLTRQMHLFDGSEHGRRRAPVELTGIEDPRIQAATDPDTYRQFREELEILDIAGDAFDLQGVQAGKITPVFFGSAMTNFGVQLFLDTFTQMALRPTARAVEGGAVDPGAEEFSGFVFKIQANMDAKHRDCIAFVRVCSGRFEKDMTVNHVRTGKRIRLTRPQKLFGQEREVIEEAYAGDIIGLTNPGVFAIGDTVCVGKPVHFAGIPQFPPELFALLRNPNPSKYKNFLKGIEQLSQEGAVQVMYDLDESRRDPVLAAVGNLQFEVIQSRMESEYGVETLLEPLPYKLARWIEGDPEAIAQVNRYPDVLTVKDRFGRRVVLFKNEWAVDQMKTRNPKLEFLKIAPL
ncbi:peptide chain release factor 3 [Anthocerotibacter panamensis]|uniref:peptide chain release factor 3 n=1 Tax=Anthocerotibacter panamensis TaxID=2857077 RepID=UPI001C4088F9|nr:peptide chain release factor 3 [Anthocerotibacter panamensis]